MNHETTLKRIDRETLSLLALLLVITVSNALFLYAFLSYGG